MEAARNIGRVVAALPGKPPVRCPSCGQMATWAERKAFCGSCGWNVACARNYLLRQIRNRGVGVLLFATFVAVQSLYLRGRLPFRFLFPALVVFWLLSSFAFLLPLWKLPKLTERPLILAPVQWQPRPRPQFRFKVLNWRSLSAIMILVVAAPGVLLGLPHEWERLRHWVPTGTARNIAAGALVIYLLFHAAAAIRFVRHLSWEWKLVRSGEVTVGRIFEQSPSDQGWAGVSYEFCDALGNRWKGQGVDPSQALFEGMDVAVLFNSEAPEQSAALIGLTFHQPVE
jgi:hypothetical protein